MSQLVLAFYGEGPTDERFLPPLIQRAAERILLARGRATVDVLPPQVLSPRTSPGLPYKERIADAAQQAVGYHALIVHTDADSSTTRRAYDEKIAPALSRIDERQKAGVRLCNIIIPVIPVRMIESWMLADPVMLLTVIGTSLTIRELDLPIPPHEVESVLDPKHKLNEVVRRAAPNGSRRRIKVSSLYEPMARQINLDQLERIPSYQEFLSNLSDALGKLQLLEP